MPTVEQSPLNWEDEARGTRRVIAHCVSHHVGGVHDLLPHSLGEEHSAEKDHGFGTCDS